MRDGAALVAKVVSLLKADLALSPGEELQREDYLTDDETREFIGALEALPSKSAEKAPAVDNLSVWCALCQETMSLVTGANVVDGWYACEKGDHAVVISELSEASPKESATA